MKGSWLSIAQDWFEAQHVVKQNKNQWADTEHFHFVLFLNASIQNKQLDKHFPLHFIFQYIK